MKALLIIDIQNDYFEGGAMPLVGAFEAAQKAKSVLEHFRKNSLPVIFIQHIAARPEAGFFLPDTKGVEIYEGIKPQSQEKVIVKYFPNSFRETNLDEYLKNLKVDELVITGMMTHMCVDATTRAAKDLGYDCMVISNACATRDLEIFGEKVKAQEVQKSFLAALDYFYSDVVMAEDYLAKN
ncbi:MAG TPA: cysteine hydrolase [Dysgonomonas sp.]|nr:cysteine hydrolase [Dysgonomonas sp.]